MGRLIEPLTGFHEAGFWRNIPGMIVGLSFAFVATKYYMNIFQTLSVKQVSRLTDLIIRLNSFFFAIPILWTIVIEPRDWPICSAVGVFAIGLNNLATYRLARQAFSNADGSTPVARSGSMSRFLGNFRGWWLMNMVYFAGLIMIGVLLAEKGRLIPNWDLGYQITDEGMYAVIVAVYINMLKIYATNCTTSAPGIRGGLSRLYSFYKRHEVLSSESGLRQSSY